MISPQGLGMEMLRIPGKLSCLILGCDKIVRQFWFCLFCFSGCFRMCWAALSYCSFPASKVSTLVRTISPFWASWALGVHCSLSFSKEPVSFLTRARQCPAESKGEPTLVSCVLSSPGRCCVDSVLPLSGALPFKLLSLLVPTPYSSSTIPESCLVGVILCVWCVMS